MGRWLRNRGFAFTADQKFARWEDIGGPGRFERWALPGPWTFVAGRALSGLGGVVGALLVGWLLPGDTGAATAVAGGMLLGTVLVVLLAGHRMWQRERDLYDAWLNKQRRRQAAAQSSS